MAWFRLDDQIAFHQKVMEAGNEAFGAWVRMGTWSSGRSLNGKVTASAALTIAGSKKVVDRLVTAGLLDRDGDDYAIHDYLDWNPSADEVEQKRANRAAAGQRGGKRSGESRRSKGEATDEAFASPFAQQTGSKPRSESEAKTNPVPVPVPVASHEATTGSLSHAHARVEATQPRLLAEWEAAGLKGGPQLTPVVYAIEALPEAQRMDSAVCFSWYAKLVAARRAANVFPNVGVDHLLKSLPTIVELIAGDVTLDDLARQRDRRDAKPSKVTPPRAAAPETVEEEL